MYVLCPELSFPSSVATNYSLHSFAPSPASNDTMYFLPALPILPILILLHKFIFHPQPHKTRNVHNFIPDIQVLIIALELDAEAGHQNVRTFF